MTSDCIRDAEGGASCVSPQVPSSRAGQGGPGPGGQQGPGDRAFDLGLGTS